MPNFERINDIDGLRKLLTDYLPWSPCDFVPNISRFGDRRIHADHLCRKLSAENDFRFTHRSGCGDPQVVLAERLPWDSEFFGFGIAKLHGVFPSSAPLHVPRMDFRPAIDALLDVCRRADLHYLFAHVDPRDLAMLRALGGAGFSLVETRYFHHGPIPPQSLAERFPVRKAVEADIPSLARIAVETINPYDRFHADPAFPKEAVNRLMAKWVEESVAGRMADVVIVPDTTDPTAFVSYRYHRDRWHSWEVPLAQGMLSAVSAEFLGWMGKLDPEILHHLHGMGARHVYGSTQVTNAPILWFAQEQGARFGRCEHIFRRLLD